MSECKHRSPTPIDHEFSRVDDRRVVQVFGCGVHDRCTLQDNAVADPVLGGEFEIEGCEHLGDKVRELPSTCCSAGPIVIRACAIFEECSTLNPTPQVPRSCNRCNRHSQRVRLVAICDGCDDRA
jgi:hypothetical protein